MQTEVYMFLMYIYIHMYECMNTFMSISYIHDTHIRVCIRN